MEDEQLLNSNNDIQPLGPDTLPQEPVFKSGPPLSESPQLDTNIMADQLRAKSMSSFGLGMGQLSVLNPKANKVRPQRMLSPSYFQTLSDGTRITRQEKFNPGLSPTANEELLAESQTGGSMFGRALSRFGGQTGINVLGGTAGTVYGLFQAVKEGSLQSFYNNDFSRYLEDLRKRNDLSNRIYTPKGYDDLNFFQKMGTGKFYADELTGGLSFLAGTIVSEGLWAVATGGTGVLAKGALGGVGRAAQKALVNKKLPGVLANAKKEGKDLLARSWKGKIDDPMVAKTIQDATIRAGNIQNAFNKTRFTLTSAGYEASVESLGYLEEAEQEFIAKYRDEEGRDPTPEEVGRMKAGLLDGANSVFFSNMALVGFSNHVVLGKMLLGRNTTQKVTNSWFKENMMGIGTKTLKDGTRETLKAKNWQKVFRTAYGFGKPMFTEGVVEEGGQAVISKSIQDYVLSGYDADATNDNLTLIDAIKSGIEETYTSKQGLTEVGLGALIGIFGGGMSTGFRFNEAAREQKALEQTVKYTNSYTAENLINNMIHSNRMTQAVKNAETAAEQGDRTAEMTYDTAAMTAFVERGLIYGDSKDVINEFNSHLQHADTEALAKDMGMSVKEVDQWKRVKSQEFAKVAKEHSRNLQFAEALLGDTNVAGLDKLGVFDEQTNRKLHLQTAIAFAMTMGKRSDDFAQMIADQLKQVVAKDVLSEAVSAIDVNTRLAKISKPLKEEFTQLTKQKEQAEQKIANLEQEIKKRQAQPEQEGVNKQGALVELSTELERITSELNSIESRRQLAVDAMNIDTLDGLGLTVEQLDNQAANVAQLQKTLESMTLRDPEANAAVKDLIVEYDRALKNAQAYEETVRAVLDPKTRINVLNGWAASLFNKRKKLNDETGQYFTDLVKNYNDEVARRQARGLSRPNNAPSQTQDDEDPKNNEPAKEDPTTKPAANPVEEMVNTEASTQESEPASAPVIEQIRGKVKEAVGKNTYTRSRFVGVEQESKKAIPTTQEVDRYNELLDKAEELPTPVELVNNETAAKEKMALEEKEFEEFKQLNTKLNNWEILSGKDANESSIAELLLLAQQVQDGIEENTTVDNVPVQHFYIPKDSDQKDATGPNKGLDGIISPDISAAKKVKDGTYELVHTKPLSLLDMFPGSKMFVVIKGRPVAVETIPESKLNELSREAGAVFLLQPEGTNAKGRIKVRITERQRLKIDSDAFEGLIGPNSTVRVLDYGNTNFMPVYTRNADGSYSIRDGDFVMETTTDNEIITLDKDALYGVEEGTPLRTIVNKNDAYNAMLLEKLEKGEMTEAEVANEMVIYLALEGAPNDIVGVVRALKPQTHGNSKGYGQVALLRKLAFERMRKDARDKVEIGISIPVRTVFSGTPNISVTEGQGGTVVPQALEITEEALNQVIDYGYIQDGKAQTQNKLELSKAEIRFAKKASEQEANKGKKVPFVVVNHKGRNLAMPVSLVKGQPRGVKDILDKLEGAGQTTSEAEALYSLNEAAKEVGIDFRDYKIASVSDDVQEINRLLNDIAEAPIKPNVENWVQPGHNKADLMVQARTPVDLTGNIVTGAKGMLDLSGMGLPTEGDMLTEQNNVLSDLLLRVDRVFAETEPFSESGDNTKFFEAMYEKELILRDPKNFLDRSRNKNILIDAFGNTIPKKAKEVLGDKLVNQIKEEIRMYKLLQNGISPNESFRKKAEKEINQLKEECS